MLQFALEPTTAPMPHSVFESIPARKSRYAVEQCSVRLSRTAFAQGASRVPHCLLAAKSAPMSRCAFEANRIDL